MKSLRIALYLSLALNFGLAARYMAIRLMKDSKPLAVPQSKLPTEIRSADKAAVSAPTESSALCASLRKMGMNEESVKHVMNDYLSVRRHSIERELWAKHINELPVWKRGLVSVRLTRDEQKRLADLQRDEQAEMSRLFGPEWNIGPTDLAFVGYLPPDVRQTIASITADFGSRIADARDAHTRDELVAARDLEVKKLLSDEDWRQYEKRESMTTAHIASRLEYVSDADAKADAIYTAQRSFEQKMAAVTDPRGAGVAAVNEFRGELKSTLGQNGFLEWQSTQLPEYKALVDAQNRFGLSADQFTAVQQLPEQLSEEAQRIDRDRTLSDAEIRQRLAALAEKGQQMVLDQLGSDAGSAYLKASGQWLDLLKAGKIYMYTSDGTFFVHSRRKRIR